MSETTDERELRWLRGLRVWHRRKLAVVTDAMAMADAEVAAAVSGCRRDQQDAATRMSEALKLIAAGGCENRTSGSCVTDQSRSPIAQYTAERWCHACIAAHALGRSSDRAALAGEVNPE